MRKAITTILLMALCMAAAGCNSKVVMPTIANNAARVHTPGKIVWYDLYSTDMTTVSNFYDALFGWDFIRTNDRVSRYKNIVVGPIVIGNLIGREAEPGNSEWLCYMSVRSVDEALEAAQNMGGSITQPAKEMPDRGRIGTGIDPQGANFALVTSSTGDPISDKIRLNRWIGCELWSTDADGSLKFYRSVADFKGIRKDMAGKGDHAMVPASGNPTGGVVQMSGNPLKTRWIPYVGVRNILATVTKAQSMGGEILVPPDPTIMQGRVAIIKDPSGAIFGVQQIR